MSTIAERARDVRHKVAEAALEAGVQWSYGLDYELDAILRDALEAQQREYEARFRHAVLVAWNTTLNNNGGIGYGERAADAVKAAVLRAYAAEPPAWALTDEVIELPRL